MQEPQEIKTRKTKKWAGNGDQRGRPGMNRDVPCNLDDLVPPEERLTGIILSMSSTKCPYIEEAGEVFYCSAGFDSEALEGQELCKEIEKRLLSIEVLEEKCFGDYASCPEYRRYRRMEELFGL